MQTKNICKRGLPCVYFLDFSAIDPRMQTGINRGPLMQYFAYGDLVTKAPYAYNNHMQTVRDWTIPILAHMHMVIIWRSPYTYGNPQMHTGIHLFFAG